MEYKRSDASTVVGRTPHSVGALVVGGTIVLILFGAIVWMIARYTTTTVVKVPAKNGASGPVERYDMLVPAAPKPAPAARKPTGFVLDDAAKATRQRALAQIRDPAGDTQALAPLRRVAIALPPPAAANGKPTAIPTPVVLSNSTVATAAPKPATPKPATPKPAASGSNRTVVDPATATLRQRALAQIPDPTGDTLPIVPLRRVAIALPPPAAANGKAVALPAPLLINGSTPAAAGQP